MSLISFFPAAFCNNDEIIKNLCSDLQLDLYTDDDLISETVAIYGIKEDVLRKALFEKTSVFNTFTLAKEKIINLFCLVLASKLSTANNTIFYGFHSVLIPENITDILRVLVITSKENRVANAVKEGLSEREANKEIKKRDISAYRWTDFLFSKEAFEDNMYDVVVTDPLEEDAANTISRFFHKTALLPSDESRQAREDMRCASLVEHELLKAGHSVTVNASKSSIDLIVHKSTLNFSGLQQDLTELALTVPGVTTVNVHKALNYSESIYRQQKFDLPSKVLFVDDEKTFVQTVSERLISRDVGTYGVYSGEDALVLMEDEQPDVMVLDMNMPGIQGIDVLRKTKEKHPEVEVIILTGHGNLQDEKECMQLGAFSYINKPVDIEDLSAVITSANEKKRQSQG